MFGDRLKELRKQSNMSQDKLGEILGVTSNAIYSWEVGKAQPSIETIRKLADIFKVSTDYLLGVNMDNLSEIEKLNKTLRETGMMKGEDLTKEEFEKLLKIAEVMRERIDTEK